MSGVRKGWTAAFAALGLVACGATMTDPKRAAAAREVPVMDLREVVPDGFSGAAFVMSGDRLLLMAGFGIADRETGTPATPDTLFQIASVSKQFTAAAILLLQVDGRLDVHDPVTRYLDDVPDDKRTITLHQLLTHTSGLPHRVGECSSASAAQSREAYVRHVLAAPLEHQPGAAYLYSNDGYGLLGVVIERVSGQRYEKFLRERLFAPAGMMRTGYTLAPALLEDVARSHAEGGGEFRGNLSPTFRDAEGPAWCNRASGGLLSSARDMQRWTLALRAGRVLPADLMQAMLSPHVPEATDGASHHGYGWSILPTSRGTRLAAHDGSLSGFFTAELRWYLEEDVVIYVAANASDSPAPPVARALSAALLDR